MSTLRKAELSSQLRPAQFFPAGLPRGFVRLVYSLGYGENEWLDSPIAAPPNTGTRQFWELFYSCVHRNLFARAVPPRFYISRTSAAPRMRNKLELLERLQDQGVWLVDASIAALYLPGRPKPSPAHIESVLQASWDSYAERVVAEASPDAILCVGYGVARALSARLDRSRIPWSAVPQPNARISTAEHLRAFAAYGAVCNNPSEIRNVSFAG